MNKIRINSASLPYLTNLFCASNPLQLGIDLEDVQQHVVEKTGMMYCETKLAGQSVASFLKQFFADLMEREQVQNCSHIMICVDYGTHDNITEYDVQMLCDFADTMDDKECIWGVRQSKKHQTSVYVACTVGDKRFASRQMVLCDPPAAGKSLMIDNLLIELIENLGRTDAENNREPRREKGTLRNDLYEMIESELRAWFDNDRLRRQFENENIDSSEKIEASLVYAAEEMICTDR